MLAKKITMIALSALALSSAAFAGGGHGRGHDRGHGHRHGRYEARHIVVEKRYAPSCHRNERVVYVPVRHNGHARATVTKPGVQIVVALGF